MYICTKLVWVKAHVQVKAQPQSPENFTLFSFYNLMLRLKPTATFTRGPIKGPWVLTLTMVISIKIEPEAQGRRVCLKYNNCFFAGESFCNEIKSL